MKLGKRFFEQKVDERKIPHDEPLAKEIISTQILSMLPIKDDQPVIIVCIGTDRSNGDSLGPLTGTFLQEKGPSIFSVYGTLDDPIHAVNLEEKLKAIHEMHENPFIIAIDACLGKLKSVGMIQIMDGPVKPGAGVKKELPSVGDMHITGIVNVSGFMEFFVLQNTRLNLVVKMAKTIAGGIYRASRAYQQPHIHELDWDNNHERTI
ncbi:spore protease YyaC [Heyndrickxia sporothermodurans]|uniref:spore protease YyaC n=1 Tax=Heyndrickxia sporothermodurans TaxID=46224 RepID=UPI00192AB658|nr:spore protease YyaC [Heyndrickxia sporothermodurans]MBL5797087.1 spore protease YyaC [Heyndrickxia sporothermodurans]MBL5832434.1 spore protease YyaC [Heyndrickxia sporothermodurans]